jgi:hypothetical protein
MKKIFSRSITLALLGSWIVVAITSSGKHDTSCKQEWRAAFGADKSSNGVANEGLPEKQQKQSRIEIHIPGALNSFLFQ